jgi:hypothetical protein
MARGTPTYFSGTIEGGNTVEDFYDVILDRLSGANAYQSGGVDAWEEFDPIVTTAGSKRYIFRSLGDRTLVSGAGDAGLFIEVLQSSTTAIDFKAYQDWTTASSGSGSRQSFSATYSRTTLTSSDTLQYWGVLNEYEFAMVWKQGGATGFIHFGSPERTHIPSDGNGIGFTTGAATAGSSVVLSVDRDLQSSLAVGQKIWIYNQTAAAAALEDDTVEIVEVEAVSASTVTIDTLAGNKASGAIVGLDPCPMFANAYTANVVVYMTNHSDGSWTSATGQTHGYVSTMSTLTESNLDPGNSQLYYGARLMVTSSTATKGGVRGTCELVSNWAWGTQSDADRMLTDYAGSAADAWKVFPRLAIPAASFAFAIGPGATS